jgi:hypothetical protein
MIFKLIIVLLWFYIGLSAYGHFTWKGIRYEFRGPFAPKKIMKEITMGGARKATFLGHRVILLGKHPQAGKYGTYIRDDQQEATSRPVVKLEEGGEEVLVTKSKHWMLA